MLSMNLALRNALTVAFVGMRRGVHGAVRVVCMMNRVAVHLPAVMRMRQVMYVRNVFGCHGYFPFLPPLPLRTFS